MFEGTSINRKMTVMIKIDRVNRANSTEKR